MPRGNSNYVDNKVSNGGRGDGNTNYNGGGRGGGGGDGNNNYNGGGRGGGGQGGQRRPPSSKGHGSDVCIPFLAGKCTFEKGCRKRHPTKEELPRLLARYKQIRCRFADECYTDGCLFLHPKEAKGKLDGPAFIESNDFPPLKNNSGDATAASGNDGSDGVKCIPVNSNSAWNNKNSNATTNTSAPAVVVPDSSSSNRSEAASEISSNDPASSSGRPSPTQDQQQQQPPNAAWGYPNGNGGPPQQQQGGGPPPQMMMNHPQQGPPPNQGYYGGPHGGPPGPNGYPMIDPNTGYPMQIDPAYYHHQMQQQQQYHQQYAQQQQAPYPMMTGYNMPGPPMVSFNAEAKEFVPEI